MKNIYIIIATILLALPITAQEQMPKNRFYFSVHSGYNFSSGNTEDIINSSLEEIGWRIGSIDITGTEQTVSIAKLNLGSGLNYGASFGFNYNKYLGAELAVSYIKSESEIYYQGPNFIESYTFNSKMLQIKPSLIFSAGFAKVNPYIKFGLVLGTGSINTYRFSQGPAISFQKNYLKDGGLAVGYTGAFGIDYNIGNNLALTLDANFINLVYHPKKETITIQKLNNIDDLPSLTIYYLQTEYSDEIDASVLDLNAPRKRVTPSYSFGSFGFNLGVKYGF